MFFTVKYSVYVILNILKIFNIGNDKNCIINKNKNNIQHKNKITIGNKNSC